MLMCREGGRKYGGSKYKSEIQVLGRRERERERDRKANSIGRRI